ncbi:hypothetical protein GM3708_1948 [Geminocystis sp. NIES-3708]|nr:hypothetical protein GM3708_1948 [Geminocystis sp. NIES-3708]
MIYTTLQKSLNIAFWKVKVLRSCLDIFKESLNSLLMQT